MLVVVDSSSSSSSSSSQLWEGIEKEGKGDKIEIEKKEGKVCVGPG